MTNEEFVCLVSDAETKLYRVAKSILRNDEDCADAMQSAILNAFDKLSTLKQEKYFTTWLTRILINECYQILRSRREQVSYEEYMENQESPQEGGEVYRAVMTLEERYRLPFVLYYIQGYSVKEVASILEISVSNVKIRLSRARGRLQDMLKGE
ncbi:MAG: sigma-70 family RNA polymerase sigma factor [Lachnospiraceae bacterium]|nr:sigma-70 family RNA polymerase sigma factor [Lachnospiraceae bacterium]